MITGVDLSYYRLQHLSFKHAIIGHVTMQPLLGLLSWYPVMLSSLCNSFEDGPPVQSAGSSIELQWLETHWFRVLQIWIHNLTINGSDNGLPPGRCQTIIWTNAGILSWLLIGPSGINFNEIFIEIHIFSFKKMHLKMSANLSRPQCVKKLEDTRIIVSCNSLIFIMGIHIQWNLSVTTTYVIKFITCDLFSNVF